MLHTAGRQTKTSQHPWGCRYDTRTYRMIRDIYIYKSYVLQTEEQSFYLPRLIMVTDQRALYRWNAPKLA